MGFVWYLMHVQVSVTDSSCLSNNLGVAAKDCQSGAIVSVLKKGNMNSPWVGRAGAVAQNLMRSMVRQTERSREAKLGVYHVAYVPVFTYRQEVWAVIGRIKTRNQAAEMPQHEYSRDQTASSPDWEIHPMVRTRGEATLVRRAQMECPDGKWLSGRPRQGWFWSVCSS